MNRPNNMTAFLAALLGLSIASSAQAAPPVFHVDDDADCADNNRQAPTITGGWAGYANQAYMILWLKTDPSTDPNLVYTIDVVHKGTTVITGQPVQFGFLCPSPDSDWRYAELVYGGFISGDKYTFVLHDPQGNELDDDSVRLVNGPGI
jgi:hypothetical protein